MANIEGVCGGVYGGIHSPTGGVYGGIHSPIGGVYGGIHSPIVWGLVKMVGQNKVFFLNINNFHWLSFQKQNVHKNNHYQKHVVHNRTDVHVCK